MRLTHAYLTALLCILTHVPHMFHVQTVAEGVARPIDFNRTKIREKRHFPLNFDSSASRCQVGSVDVQCLPPFKNIIYGARVETSTTCGLEKPQRLCSADGTCQLCESRPGKRFSAEYLTDKHESQNHTCWASGQVYPGDQEQAINLTLSLGKRFEVYYISLQPCSIGSLPDSIAIYKSSDFGRNWRPWHFFSTDCYRAFGLPTTDEYNSHITSANLQEVLCVALQPQESYLNRQKLRHRSLQSGSLLSSKLKELGVPDTSPDWVIAFSTTLGRPAQRPWSPALVDWMTMTDIRISMTRFPQTIRNNEQKSKMLEVRTPMGGFLRRSSVHRLSSSRQGRLNNTGHFSRNLFLPRNTRALRRLNALDSLNFIAKDPSAKRTYLSNQTMRNEFVQAETDQSFKTDEPDILSDSEFYAFADLAIGGRCKCNGHAGDCVYGLDGQLRCACEHNTEGDDCERCKSGYMDRPWERATEHKSNACTSKSRLRYEVLFGPRFSPAEQD